MSNLGILNLQITDFEINILSLGSKIIFIDFAFANYLDILLPQGWTVIDHLLQE